MKLNTENPELVAKINAALKENIKKYGKPFCPCVAEVFYLGENSDDFVCPCRDFRENTKPGELCHCSKFVKE